MTQQWPPIEAIIDQAIGRDGRIERKTQKPSRATPWVAWSYDNPIRRIAPGFGHFLEPGYPVQYACPCRSEYPFRVLRPFEPTEMRHQCYAKTDRGETERLDVWVGQCPECKTIWWETRR